MQVGWIWLHVDLIYLYISLFLSSLNILRSAATCLQLVDHWIHAGIHAAQ